MAKFTGCLPLSLNVIAFDAMPLMDAVRSRRSMSQESNTAVSEPSQMPNDVGNVCSVYGNANKEGTLDYQGDLLNSHKRKRDESLDQFGSAKLAKGTPHDFHDAYSEPLTKAIANMLETDSSSLRDHVKNDGGGNINDEEGDRQHSEGENEEVAENGEEDDVSITDQLDERKFFSASAFTSDEVSKMEPIMRKAMEVPIALIEKDGYEAYKRFVRERSMKRNRRNEDQLQNTRQAILDSAIRGDPRDYQRIFFEIAKTQNTIINLGTGFGKTLIALLCIRHFSADFESGRQTLFLVPSVALAVQQSMTLRANLPGFRIQTACYASSNSVTNRHGLNKANVIVATHGAILDLMMHYADIVNMSKFNLLVIDECHYATGNHAYSVIMKKFYHTTPKDERPRVLGLTASPLVNVKATHSDDHLKHMLGSLEQILDSTLVSISGLQLGQDSISGLDRKSAEERVIQYGGRIDIAKSIPSAENLPLHQSRYREFRQLEGLYQDLGALVVSIYCKTLIREISRNSYEQESNQQFNWAVKHLTDVALFCDQECVSAFCGVSRNRGLALFAGCLFYQNLANQPSFLDSAAVGRVFCRVARTNFWHSKSCWKNRLKSTEELRLSVLYSPTDALRRWRFIITFSIGARRLTRATGLERAKHGARTMLVIAISMMMEDNSQTPRKKFKIVLIWDKKLSL